MVDSDLLENLGKSFELVLTKQESDFLDASAHACRAVFNVMLEYKKLMWAQWKVNVTPSMMNSQLTLLKKEEGLEWLRLAPSEALQQKQRDMFTSYERFF